MVSEEFEKLELKIDLILKAFFSFYGDDVGSLDLPFDDMKNEVNKELLRLLDLDTTDEARRAFIESFAMIPYVENRNWWLSSMKDILSRADSRLQVLEAISKSSAHHTFPDVLRPQIKRILKGGKVNEISALLRIFSRGYGFGEDDLLDEDDWIALSKDKREKVRIEAVEAISEWLQNTRPHLDKEIAGSMLSFCNDPSNKVAETLVPVLHKLLKASNVELSSFLKNKNDNVRFWAVSFYLGYNPKGPSWSTLMQKPDLKEVAKLVSDPFELISKLAEKYLDRAQSSRRR